MWGAEGGSATYNNKTGTGGYGGYSTGYIELQKDTKLYIGVGGMGQFIVTGSGNVNPGGFNGGSNSTQDGYGVGASSGGVTHIATASGLLSELSSNTSSILIVAGAGAGGGIEYNGRIAYGGNAGGYIGNNGRNSGTLAVGNGGTQSTGGAFGKANHSTGWYGTGGAGYYGGGNGCGGGGGSSYIGNEDLTTKIMYCYNCQESRETATKTISTECVEGTPTKNCAKKGNGYARITMYRTIESDDDYDD